MSDDGVPEGFERHTRRSGLTDPWEPIYARRSAREIRLGFRAAASHANSRGFVHGGLISALADNAMGLSCGQQLTDISTFVTVSLSLDFVASAKDRPMGGNTARSHKDRQIAVLCTCARHGGRFCVCPRKRRLHDGRPPAVRMRSSMLNKAAYSLRWPSETGHLALEKGRRRRGGQIA